MIEAEVCTVIPWLIRQTAHYLQTGELLSGDSDIDEKFELARQHAQSLIVLKGENGHERDARPCSWYMKGLKYSHRKRLHFTNDYLRRICYNIREL